MPNFMHSWSRHNAPGRLCQLDNGFVPILPVQPIPHTSQPWLLLNTLVATFSHRMPVNWCRWAKKQIEEGSKTKLCFTSCIYFNPDCTWMGGSSWCLVSCCFFSAASTFSSLIQCFLISFILFSSALSSLPMLIGTVLTILKATNPIQVKKSEIPS